VKGGDSSDANYPSRPDREDQTWRIRLLRDIAFGNIASNKLDSIGPIVGASFLDADVYASNFALGSISKKRGDLPLPLPRTRGAIVSCDYVPGA